MDNILILTNDESKRCSRCGKELPVSHYHKSSRSKDGYQSWCIECKREYNHGRSLFRTARRLSIHHQSISSIIGGLGDRTRGELTDTRLVFEEALKIVEQHIQKKA